MRKFLFLLLVTAAAFGSGARRTRERITLFVGDTIVAMSSVQTGAVLSVRGGNIIASDTGTTTAYLRFFRPSHGGKLGAMVAADSVDITVVRKDAPVPPSGDGEVIAQSDFNDGTFGPFGHSDNEVTVIDDPTNSGHGKVVEMHYRRDSSEAPGQGVDRNRNITFDYARGVHLGETLVFEGDLYMPSNSALTGPGQEWWARKLLYWQRDPAGDGPNGNGFFTYILGSFGQGYSFANVIVPVSGISDEQRCGPCYLAPAQFHLDHWQHFKYEVRLQSSIAAKDALTRLTLDGVKVYEYDNHTVMDPAWVGVHPEKMALRYLLIGDQVNSSNPYNERRYWDNISLRVIPKHP